MHISIDAIGITKQCSTDAKYWAELSEVGLLTEQIAFHEWHFMTIFNPISHCAKVQKYEQGKICLQLFHMLC